MAVTVKLKSADAEKIFKNGQTGTVTFSLDDFQKICEFEKAFNEFVKWSGREVIVKGQGRTPSYNKSVKGNSGSSHLKALAKDTYFKKVSFDKARVIKYMKKWKEICEKHGIIGEAGFYPSYSYDGCTGMLHLGAYITYSKKFTNWMTDSKGQHNNYYDV